MAKKVGVSYRDIIQSIRKGECAPVYILSGEEAYYIDLIVQNFEKYVVADDDKDFNLDIFYGQDADIDYVIGVSQQFPVLAERKLVILKEAQCMSQAKTQLNKFASYVKKPSPGTVFVIAYKGEPFTASSPLVKAAKEGGGVVFESIVPRDYELPAHIRDYCTSRKVGIEDKAVNLLAEYIGAPLSKLFGELNKLISIKGNAGDNNIISCEDIEKNIGISKDYNNFELQEAIGSKNYPKAIKIIKYFEANPKTNKTPATTATIFNFFSNILIAHYLPDKSDAALKEAFGFKAAVQVKNLKMAMANYSIGQTVNAIHHLREFDTKSKGVGSMLNEYDLLAELIFKIFT